jgi:regulator of replication initiation timing
MSESERTREEIAENLADLIAINARLEAENKRLTELLVRERNINNELSWRIDNSRGGY